MPWLRIGDNALTHPAVSALADVKGADARTRLEVWGFVSMCASVSAAHLTDGLLDRGTLELVGLSRWRKLAALAVESGLLTTGTRQGRPYWRIIDDPDLLHVRSRDEVEWQRQADRDRRNPELTVPVRLRDGDECRYCGRRVDWRDRKSQARPTMDHRRPGDAATVETYVVACFKCNRDRSDNPRADELLPLLPAPARPYLSPVTLEWLKRHGIAARVDRDGRLVGSTQISARIYVDTTDKSRAGSTAGDPDAGYGSGRDGSGPADVVSACS